MGHAARDPVFLAALTIADQDLLGVGDLCLRCHAPEAWLQGRCIETSGRLLQPDDSGVTCSVCHRMEPNPYVRNGQYIVADDTVMRGPYEVTPSPHQHAYATWISDPALCGTCHNLFNPLVKRRTLTGTTTNMPFPEQATYEEWAQSAFAREGGDDCISCHMPDNEGVVGRDGPIRVDRSSHELSGANTFLLESIALLFPDLGLATNLENGRARVLASLRRAARVEVIDAPTRVARGERFEVRVQVTNLTGHKFPTGYPEGRRAFLVVRGSTLAPAWDQDGEPIDPLEIYQSVQGQAGLGPGHHVALNDTIFLDTRIPPRGMISTATIAPVGKRYEEVAPGMLAHWDELVWTATAPCDLAETSVRGELGLFYQVLTPRYANTLITEAAIDPRTDLLALAFMTLDPQPIEIASTSVEVMIDPASECAPPSDAGIPDRGGVPAADAGQLTDAGAADAGTTPPDEGCDCRTAARPMTDGLGHFGVLLWLAWAGRWGLRRRKGSE